ncbi:MAG TPA: J domain-containing protein [Allosphingosinicella sp.]|nr:J domain-containing protein [Allosphingosinicella sp.]
MARPYSFYDDLSVTPDAQPAVVEAAYRALMKQHHPDHAGAAERAAQINAAFAVLRDPQRRAAYDRREWTRKQEMLAAEAEHLIGPSRFSARAGWIVAALLGLLVAALGGERYGLTVVPERSAQAKAPATPAAVTLEEEIDEMAAAALALARPAQTAVAAAASSPQLVMPTQDELPPATRAAETRPHAQLRRRPPSRPAPAPAAAAPRRETAEGDFLEREGFIY